MKRIQLPTTGKRIASVFIDFALMAGLTCLFYFCVFNPIVKRVVNYDQLNSQIVEAKKESNLFNNEGTKTLLEDNPDASETELKQPLKKFYIDYMNKYDGDNHDYDDYWYYTHIFYCEDYLEKYKSKDTISAPTKVLCSWNVNKDCYTWKSDVTDEEKKEFYQHSFNNAIYRLNNVSPIADYLNKQAWGNIRAWMYASLLGSMIPCLIIPLILKDGKSIGKLVTKLIILTDEGYQYKKWKLIIRYLAIYIIELFGGVVTISLIFVLSCCLVMFSKKHRALHDYIAFSVVIDETQSIYFKDKQEEEAFTAKKTPLELTAK